MPVVSVILPTYNRAGMLPGAIASVLGQTFEEWELLIIDDGSTDATPDVVRKFEARDPRIHGFVRPHQGVGAARNLALSEAQGRYVALLDDDDVYCPDKLATQAAFLDAHPTTALVYSSVEVVNDHDHLLEVLPKRPVTDLSGLIADDTAINTASCLLRTDQLRRLGGFREDLTSAEDYELWLRVSRAFPIAFLPMCAGRYRRHGRNLTANWELCHEKTLIIYRELLQRTRPGAIHRQLKRAVRQVRRERAREYYRRATASFDAGAHRVAARSYLRALRDDPGIGTRVAWGASKPRVYRWLRPYLGWVYCQAASVRAGITQPLRSAGHADR